MFPILRQFCHHRLQLRRIFSFDRSVSSNRRKNCNIATLTALFVLEQIPTLAPARYNLLEGLMV